MRYVELPALHVIKLDFLDAIRFRILMMLMERALPSTAISSTRTLHKDASDDNNHCRIPSRDKQGRL